MAWINQRGKRLHLGVRFGGRLFRVSLKTDSQTSANSIAAIGRK